MVRKKEIVRIEQWRKRMEERESKDKGMECKRVRK